MKTSVEISNSLEKPLRKLMAQKGVTMRSLVEQGLRLVLEQHKASEKRYELVDRSFCGDGLAPGVDLSWETLERHLYPR